MALYVDCDYLIGTLRQTAVSVVLDHRLNFFPAFCPILNTFNLLSIFKSEERGEVFDGRQINQGIWGAPRNIWLGNRVRADSKKTESYK
jgi:hypothetical protein